MHFVYFFFYHPELTHAWDSLKSLYLWTEQTPDSFGYVRPTSNQPVNRDAILFNRSASNAAAIRAKHIKQYERQTNTLPAAAGL